MQAALLKQRSRLDEHQVSKLYKTARQVFRNPEAVANLAQDQTVWTSRLCTGNLVLATCTDANTGLFVQFAGQQDAADDKLLLTFGIKFCQETVDTLRNHRSTKIW